MEELHERKKNQKTVPETEMQLQNGWAPTPWQASQDARSQETHSDVQRGNLLTL